MIIFVVVFLSDLLSNILKRNCSPYSTRISSDKASNLPKRDVRFILLK